MSEETNKKEDSLKQDILKQDSLIQLFHAHIASCEKCKESMDQGEPCEAAVRMLALMNASGIILEADISPPSIDTIMGGTMPALVIPGTVGVSTIKGEMTAAEAEAEAEARFASTALLHRMHIRCSLTLAQIAFAMGVTVPMLKEWMMGQTAPDIVLQWTKAVLAAIDCGEAKGYGNLFLGSVLAERGLAALIVQICQ